MSKVFEYDAMVNIMKNPLVNGEPTYVDVHGFSRTFRFTVDGTDYQIIWYKNQSTLVVGELHVMFFDVEISNTYPSHHKSKNKLQFRDMRGQCVAAIPIEWHE